MNILETLQIVQKLEKLCDKQSEIQKRIDSIKRKNTKTKLVLFRLFHWGVSAAFWVCIIAAFSQIMKLFGDRYDDYDVLRILTICASIAGIPVLLFFIFKSILINHERKRAYTKREQRVYNECESQYIKVETEINSLISLLETSIIPYKYWHSYALEWMIEAIECKRANSLTELINLYEQFADAERRHNEQLEMLYRTRADIKVNVRVY